MSDNWDDLRYFLALARSGTISSAARTLGVRHTTVSRRITQLEASFGSRLFERTAAGYVLSLDAKALLPKIEQVEMAMTALERQVHAKEGATSGEVRVTLAHDLYESVLVSDIAQFTREFPAIELELQVSKGLKDLANREADIAIRFSPKPPDELVGRELLKLQHGIYVEKSLASEKNVPIILWGSDSEMPAWAEQHFPNSRIALRVDALSSMYQAVASGIGAAKLPRFYPNSFAGCAVARLPLALSASDWGLWVLTHPDLRATPRIQLVKNYLQQALERKRSLFTECLCPLENQ